MTQVSTAELAEVVCPPSAKEASLLSIGPEGVLLGLGFILGASVGRFLHWRKK